MSSKVVYGHFSAVSGSKVRHMYDANGKLLGTITKKDGGGYRVFRLLDGKIRDKAYLEDAYKTIRRSN